MDIPLVDLSIQHEQIKTALQGNLESIFSETSFILGKEVAQFEEEFARFCGAGYCVGVGNGTDALELLLRALGVGAGDEVIVPANSFVASALAVLRAGATPVLVDAEPDYMLIDLDQGIERIGSKTKAIMPVHLFGQMAAVDDLNRAIPSEVHLVEDAAQAHGATRYGKGIGQAGAGAAVSFYPGKNLGAYGDAGAVLTNSSEMSDRLALYRNLGSKSKYRHDEIGFNSRLDTLQAAVLLTKLHHLEAWNKQRRQAALRYDELLEQVEGVRRPSVLAGNEHVWHLYVVRVKHRDDVLAKLHAQGIGAGIHYPIPLHLAGALSSLGYGRGDFPVSESLAHEILSLPMYPGISDDQQNRVVDALVEAVKAH